MESRALGSSGLLVSVIGLGCNNFGGMIEGLDFEASRTVVHAALDSGVTLFDTSDSYGTDGGSERALGEILGARRKDIVIATKFSSPMNRANSSRYNGSRTYIIGAVEDSLKRLQTDYIDLYQYHFPDPHTPIEETLRALDDLVRQGKVRYVACSNMEAWRLVDAKWTAQTRGLETFLSTQTEYNLLNRDAESNLFPALRHTGMSLLPYFPLASGLLSGKYRKNRALPEGTRISLPYFKAELTQERLDRVEALAVFAEAQGRTLLELAIAWLLINPLVSSVIAGATRPDQITANVAATGWTLTQEDLDAIDAICANQ